MVYSQFLSLLVCQATKSDPEIELRFLLRQFNWRLRMEQLKQIIEIAQEDSQRATLEIARESDFNIDARLAEPSARTGDAAIPPDPDIIVREMSHE
ncbi:MAG: hypothetical protein EZS28_051105, partial [Streblomastix strix]